MKKFKRLLVMNMMASVSVVLMMSPSFAADIKKPQGIAPVIKTPIIDPTKGTCKPVNITSESPLQPATIGQSYQYQLKTSGGKEPIAFHLEQVSPDPRSPIPAGLKFSPDGLISGTPTKAYDDNGSGISFPNAYPHSFKVRVEDSCPNIKQSIEKIFTLEVKHSCTRLSITSESQLPSAINGIPYKYQLLQVSGGIPPYVFKLKDGSSLPGGLILNPATGEISGIPNTTIFSSIINKFSILLYDSCYEFACHYQTGKCGQENVREFSLLILAPCIQINFESPDTLPQAVVGQTYKYQLKVSCDPGQLPIGYSIVIGSSLPPGLNLDWTTGEISGIPSAAGDYSFRIRATDNCFSGKQSLDKYFSLTVK
jgi:hypothetical protein